ncbi:MAG: hypothetical protein IJM90_07390 [Firmicutes bacterium]|nr:hypothetical protein [Bacillota bacterium]
MLSATLILQGRTSHELGLDRYAVIMSSSDVASPCFQRAFNGYYRVRRNEEWRRCFYSLFAKARDNHYSFEQIIEEMFCQTGNVEASFSSKMLATIDASQPIWDQYVLHNLGLRLTGTTKEEKLVNAVSLYGQIEKWYNEYLLSSNARENIVIFDRMFPSYAWLSDTKKIDCLLWKMR